MWRACDACGAGGAHKSLACTALKWLLEMLGGKQVGAAERAKAQWRTVVAYGCGSWIPDAKAHPHVDARHARHACGMCVSLCGCGVSTELKEHLHWLAFTAT